MLKGKERSRGKFVSNSATSIPQINSCLWSRTDWRPSSGFTKVSKNTWAPEVRRSLLILIPKGWSWRR